jgi:hypothetical protein
MKVFNAKVLKTDIIRFVWIPEEISQSFHKKGHIPVKGKVNGEHFQSTLAPRKNGRHILYLNAKIRDKVDINEGEIISVEIEYDPDSRDLNIPDDLEMIMSENRNVWNKFLAMTPSHRNELLKFLESAKRPETRLKRIEKIIEHSIKWKSGKTFF